MLWDILFFKRRYAMTAAPQSLPSRAATRVQHRVPQRVVHDVLRRPWMASEPTPKVVESRLDAFQTKALARRGRELAVCGVTSVV